MKDVAQDSILCCIIENASNGITIRNRYSTTPASYSAEISGCTFSNNTTTQLNNGLYASNSTNILFRNNDFTSSALVNGFSRGVVMEYCPGGSLLIIDNVITNAETGVSILQSSPYIARNSITGQSDVGYGIYLDNSNENLEFCKANNLLKNG